MFSEEKCTLCGECLVKCYYMDYSEEEAKEEFSKLIKGEPSPVTSQCITCCACNIYCPEGAEPFDLIGRRMEEAGDFIGGKGGARMMSMAKKIPSSVVEGDPGKPVISLCTVGIIPGLMDGQLFDGMTIMQGGDYWCYIGWFHAGKPSKVEENAQLFVDNVAKVVKDRKFICFHDDCFMMLDHYVKEFGITVPFEYIHIIEYLKDYVKENSSKINKLNIKVAYQQPCASRVRSHYKKKDKTLDELFDLLGVERVSRKYDREGAMCCTSVVPTEDRWWKANITDAKEAGAEAMIFLCPICNLYLRSKAHDQGLEPYMLINLVKEALGEELPHGRAGKIYS